MTSRRRRFRPWLVLAAAVGLLTGGGTGPVAAGAPVCEETGPLQPVALRVARDGVFLMVDAVIANRSAGLIRALQVTGEFYNFFGELVRVGVAGLVPADLGPGHRATAGLVVPWSEAVRTLVFRFSWLEEAGPVQTAVACRL
jgi:hypothetical protein